MPLKKPLYSSQRFKNLKSYFFEFCRNSTIHGLKFIGEKDRNVLEKIWWVFFIGVSLYIATNLITITYKKWINSPVIVTFATSETPIYEIPFPAVTICPLIKIDSNKFDFDASNKSSDDFVAASLLCPQLAWDSGKVLAFAKKDSLKFLLGNWQISMDSEDMVVRCQLANSFCSTVNYPLLTPTLTSGGVCHSFNFLDRDNLFTNHADTSYMDNILHQPTSSWSTDNGYNKKSGINTYPRRSILTGSEGGLDLILASPRQKRNNPCGILLDGFKVILHHPREVPRFDERNILIPLNELVVVGVKPNVMTTSNELRSYQAKDRKCYLETERELEFYRTYDQQNCLEECLSHYSFKKCDCVDFYMPRRNTTPICGPLQYDCLKEARYEFVVRDSEFELMEKSVATMHGPASTKPWKKKSKFIKPNCNCLPSCYSISYDAETSQIKWDWHNVDLFELLYNRSEYGLSRVNIFYKSPQFLSSVRHEIYGESEFWANCGGLLGLFTGFSVLSGIEILYYLSIRLCCNIRRRGVKNWSEFNIKSIGDQ